MGRHLRWFVLAALLVQFDRPVPAGPGAGPPSRDPDAGGLKMVGVAGCAAMACHHADLPAGNVRSAYGTWVANDPHARAYRVLFNDRSVRMQKLLAASDPKLEGMKAHQNPLCLACHGMGAKAPARLQVDGVGCERCHGPAEKWKSTHYLDNFDRKTAGFVELRDNLVTRIQTCMKCHVGDKNQEVNHDLIAAGHPRLRFEFAAYYANYPRHWPKERDTKYKDFAARAWALGQLVSARSAVELLQARAADGKKPWPEFAEYDCAACHHGLTKPSFRQDNALKLAKKGLGLRAGDLPWGTWYTALLPGKPLEDTRRGLDVLMRKRFPARAKVAGNAAKMATILDRLIKKEKGDPVRSASELLRAMKSLAANETLAERGWDEATQQYLGLAALNQAIGDQRSAHRGNAELKKALDELKKQLQGSFDKGSDPLYETPEKYVPSAVLKSLRGVEERLK